jgi:hypothetical protein
MNVSDIITVLNNHGFEDTDSTQKLFAINNAIWDFCQREPWPFLIKSLGLNFDGTNPYPSNMPADFKAVDWITDTVTGESIWPERLSTIRDRYGAQMSTTGAPFSFYFVGTQLRLYPVPPATIGRFLLDYHAWQQPLLDTSLEAAVIIPPRYHEVIVDGALQRLYKMDDDPELGAVKQQDFENRIQAIRSDAFSQQYVRGDRIYTLDIDELDVDFLP